MSKKVIIVLVIVLFIASAVFGIDFFRERLIQTGLLENYNIFGDVISVPKWNDSSGSQIVLRAKTKGEVIQNKMDRSTSFCTEDSISEMIERRKEIYVGSYKWYDGNKEIDAELFFADNNYFALICEDEANNRYCVENCCSPCDFTGDTICLPTPVKTYLSQKSIDYMKEEHKNFIQEDIYRYCTFDKAVTFYNRLDPEYVTIDAKKQTIEVQGYAENGSSNPSRTVCFDFARQTVSAKNEKGKWVTYDGK